MNHNHGAEWLNGKNNFTISETDNGSNPRE